MLYKTLHRKLRIDEATPLLKPGVNSGAPEGFVIPASLITPVVLLLKDMNIIWYVNRVEPQYT